MFSNWTRKLSGIAFVVVTLIAAAAALDWLLQYTPPKLAEWSTFLKELAFTYGIIVAISAAKSIGTEAVHKHNGKPTM